MPETACARPGCLHPLTVHHEATSGVEYGCRVTRCECTAFLDPPEEPEQPDADARRLVIEIPEGFAVTVQLVPVEGATS